MYGLRSRRVTFALFLLPDPALFDQLCAPVILLELIVQQPQLFGHFIDLILPVRYRDGRLDLNLRISCTVRRLASCIDNVLIYTDLQDQRILS